MDNIHLQPCSRQGPGGQLRETGLDSTIFEPVAHLTFGRWCVQHRTEMGAFADYTDYTMRGGYKGLARNQLYLNIELNNAEI